MAPGARHLHCFLPYQQTLEGPVEERKLPNSHPIPERSMLICYKPRHSFAPHELKHCIFILRRLQQLLVFVGRAKNQSVPQGE